MEKGFKNHRGLLCEFHSPVRKANSAQAYLTEGQPGREMILLLLPMQEDPNEGLKLNLFVMSTMGGTGNSEHRPQQGRFRL